MADNEEKQPPEAFRDAEWWAIVGHFTEPKS